MAKVKTSKQLERHFKGVSNHWRIEILSLIARNPSITVGEICDRLQGNEKTIAEHTRRLALAGLIQKEYRGRTVIHTLSPYGRLFYGFILKFQQT